MKKLLLVIAAVFIISAAGCKCCWFGEEKTKGEQILAESCKATDVDGKRGDIDSVVVVYNSKDSDNAKCQVTFKYQEPEKIRLEVKGRDNMMLRLFDGKEGWEYITGKNLRPLDKKEIEEMKFQAVYLNPAVDYRKLFAKVKLIGEAEVAGDMCWQLACTPLKKFKSKNVEIFIDKKSKMIRKTVERLKIDNDIVEFVTFFGDYENIDGIMVPQILVSQIDGNPLIESNLVSVHLNISLRRTEFEKPLRLSNTK